MSDLGTGQIGGKVHELSEKALELLEKRTKLQLRLVGPSVSAAQTVDPTLRGGYARPKPKVYTCPVCDWSTEIQWAMLVHNAVNPEYCQKMRRRKTKYWSKDVGLDT